MIIAKAPLRLTFGGGGTDLPSYYRQFGASGISVAIDKYVYIALHKNFQSGFILKYSQMERPESVDEVKHPIIREALKMEGIRPSLEIVSFADIPQGTGLGSSGAFTVALLKALSIHNRSHVSEVELAEKACEIEIDRLQQPIGKLDQYSSAFGGVTRYIFNRDDTVQVESVKITEEARSRLEDGLVLYFTGFSRNASDVLADQKKRTQAADAEMIKNLHFSQDVSNSTLSALESGNLDEFGKLLSVHWENKRKRSPAMSNASIDQAYSEALLNGAVGGKLVGAGGGGFLMFYAKDQELLRKRMEKFNYQEIRFSFDYQGVRVVSGEK